jgi:predicted kinase
MEHKEYILTNKHYNFLIMAKKRNNPSISLGASKKIINEITKQFVGSLRIVQRRTKKPIVIAMIGLVGSDKNSVARAIAKSIDATIIGGDKIRIALRKKNQSYTPVRSIAKEAMIYVVKKGGNVIMDSDFIDQEKRKNLKEKVGKIGAKLFYVRTFAERDVMIKRLIKAEYNNNNLFENSTIAIREMWRRTPHHYRWTKEGGGRFILRKLKVAFVAEIDTSKDWKKQIKAVIRKIESF